MAAHLWRLVRPIRGAVGAPIIVFRKPLAGIEHPQMEADVITAAIRRGPTGMACTPRLPQLIDDLREVVGGPSRAPLQTSQGLSVYGPDRT